MDNYSRLMGLICEKDTELAVTKCNEIFLKYAGAKTYDQVIGKTDSELVWADNADIYRKHELDALSGHNYSTIIPQCFKKKKNYSVDNLLFLHTKLQKTDSKGYVTGVYVRAVEIINQNASSLINLLSDKSPIERNIFYLGKNNSIENLSKRQSEVLFYLSIGKANKAIAKILGLSVRTIEYYVDILRNKLKCRTRWELIDFAIEKGVAQNIPEYESASSIVRKIRAD